MPSVHLESPAAVVPTGYAKAAYANLPGQISWRLENSFDRLDKELGGLSIIGASSAGCINAGL